MKRPGVKLHEALWTWWTTKRMDSEEETRKRNFRDETRKKKSRSQNFSEIMNKAMSRNLYTAMLHDLYAQMLKSSNNWIALPLIFMNATNSALSASTLSSMPRDIVVGLTLASVALNILSIMLVTIQKFFSFAERAALHDSVKNGFFDAYYAEEDLVSDLAMDSNGVFMTVVDKGKEDHLKKEEDLKKAEEAVEKAILEKIRAEEDLKRAREEVEMSQRELREAGGQVEGRDDGSGQMKTVQGQARNQLVFGKAQSVLGKAEDYVKVAEERVDKAWWAVKKAERRKRDCDAEIKQARQEKKRQVQAGAAEITSDKVIQALDENEIERRLQILADIEERLLALPDVHIPVSVARSLQPFVRDMQKKGGFDQRQHLQLFPPVLGVQSHFLNVPRMMGWFSCVSSGEVVLDLGSSCAPINHEHIKGGFELLMCGKPLFQCCGRGEKDGPEENADETVALNSIIQEHKSVISYQNSELYKCLARNQTVADRYRAAVLCATLIGVFRSLAPDRDQQLKSLILIIKLIDFRLARYVEDPVGLSRSNRTEVNDTLQRLAMEIGRATVCLKTKKVSSSKVEKCLVAVMNEIFGTGWIAWMEERQMTENLRDAEEEAISIFDSTVGKKKEGKKGVGFEHNSSSMGFNAPALLTNMMGGLLGKKPSTLLEGDEEIDLEAQTAVPSPSPYSPPLTVKSTRDEALSNKLDQVEKQLAKMTELMNSMSPPPEQNYLTVLPLRPDSRPGSARAQAPFAPHPAPSRAPAILEDDNDEEVEEEPAPKPAPKPRPRSNQVAPLPPAPVANPLPGSVQTHVQGSSGSNASSTSGLTRTLELLSSSEDN